MNWISLEISFKQFDKTFVVSRPSLVASMYGGDEIKKNAERFLNYFLINCPVEGLHVLTERSRSFKPATTSGIKRIAEKLTTRQAKYIFLKDAPEFDVGFNSMELDLGIHSFEEGVNSVHFAFPIAILDQGREEFFLHQFIALLGEIHPQHGSVGLGFSLVFGREWEMVALPQIFALAKRYHGLDIPHRFTEIFLKDKIKGPSWITYLSRDLAAHVKDLDLISTLSAEIQVQLMDWGVLIRSDRLPPIGDVNRGEKDLQNLKILKKILDPICIDRWSATNLFGSHMDEANDWFLRF